MKPVFAAVALILVVAGRATAQPPAAEVAGQVGVDYRHDSALAWSPRLTLRVAERSAIEVAATHRPVKADRFQIGRGNTAVDVVLRQSLFASGRFETYGLVGASYQRRITEFPGSSQQFPNGSIEVPAFRREEHQGAAQVGVAALWTLHPRVALRADVRALIGEDSSMSAAVGVSIPLGRHSTARRPDPAVHDSVANGAGIGAAIGAGLGAASFAALEWLLCQTEECVGPEIIFVGLGAGTAVGAVVGGVTDSLIHRSSTSSTSAGGSVNTRRSQLSLNVGRESSTHGWCPSTSRSTTCGVPSAAIVAR